MEFGQFKILLKNHVAKMLENRIHLFVADVDKDKMWQTYLDNFPPGTNEIFRERRFHDCCCCRQFIKNFGNVVTIQNNTITTIWDFRTNDDTYQPVLDAMSELVGSAWVRDVLVTKEVTFGTDKSYEQEKDGLVITWEHFQVKLPKQLVSSQPRESIGSLTGLFRDTKNVFARSLEEISRDAIETVLDLISQNSLYKGEEWKGVLEQFLKFHREYQTISSNRERDLYCWEKSVKVGGAVGRIRNHSIGAFLTDISEGMELDQAVQRYERIVAPTNYKRPKAIFTKKMVEQAQQTITELGFLDSLGRRFATIEDISINNILFANRDSLRKMSGDVFADLKNDVAVNPKQFDRVEEVTIDHFVEQILPRVTQIEVFLENRHSPNLVSVIAPMTKGSPTMFKWDNAFSWAYNGNITDSMKERVKAAGGNVEGVLRFSLQWNENGENQNDFDAHCVEPGGNHIYYPVKRIKHPSSGMLDTDIIHPEKNQVAVENIIWTDLKKMPEGNYDFYVHNYSHRGGVSGFAAEVEFDGQIHSYEYCKELLHNERVHVAMVQFSYKSGFKILQSLPPNTASKIVWGLQTNQFHPVLVFMYSPNYWNLQTGRGHRHYLFILKGCVNDTNPNGFFNEFLKEDLMKHKRVFEALASKMRVEPSENQLSGLGFSATKRNSLVCKVEGHVSRMLKIIF